MWSSVVANVEDVEFSATGFTQTRRRIGLRLALVVIATG
jgi:hypothetical protein